MTRLHDTTTSSAHGGEGQGVRIGAVRIAVRTETGTDDTTARRPDWW